MALCLKVTVSLPSPRPSGFSPVLPSRHRTVLCSACASVIHSGGLCDGCKVCVQFHTTVCGRPGVLALYIGNAHHCTALAFCQRSHRNHVCLCGCLWALYSAPALFVCSSTVTCFLDYCSFIRSPECLSLFNRDSILQLGVSQP